MQRRTPIYIVCSRRPRVGKTLLTRVLADYVRDDGRPVAAFDVNPGEYALVDYLPRHTAVASLDHTRDQIALFDQLLAADRVPKVVDLGHFVFDNFFTVIEQIGFLDEARRRSIVPVALFLADGHRRSQQGYAVLRRKLPRLAVVPVINQVLPNVTGWDENFSGAHLGDAPLVVPALSAMIRGVTERPSFSFARLISTANDRTSELYGWTRNVFLSYRELELRLLLAELTPALKISA